MALDLPNRELREILIAEGILNKSIDSEELNNKTKPQTYENALIYSGDRDKVVAIIMKEILSNSTILDIADYKNYMCRNAYAIGGGASKELDPPFLFIFPFTNYTNKFKK